MMQVLIVEDEAWAASHLSLLVQECDPEMKVVEVIDSVSGAADWLNTHPHPPLIFMDVHLGDGICFELFKRMTISSFIIFTTAYDQYALQAFKVNSVDYLLKPLSKKAVCEAILKFKKFSKIAEDRPLMPNIDKLLDLIQNQTKQYKERFVVKVGTHIRPINMAEVACFYSLDKATYLLTKGGKNYLIDYALDKVMEMLDPNAFFRISRKYIIGLSVVEDVSSLGPGRMKIKISVDTDDTLLVSRERIKDFKNWLEG